MIDFKREHTLPEKLLAALVLVGALVVACGKAQNGAGTGNTNWYLECETSNECGGSDLCQCGYCTPACDGTLDCSLSPELHCTTDPGTGRTTDPVQAVTDTLPPSRPDDAATVLPPDQPPAEDASASPSSDASADASEGPSDRNDTPAPDADAGAPPHDDAASGPDASMGSPPCGERALDACESDAACALLTARPSDGSTCELGELQAVACIENLPTTCGAAFTTALSPDGACWVFRDTCIAPGYRRAEPGECPSAPCLPAECSERDPVAECALDAECGVLMAYPVGEAGTCYDESNDPVPVGCMSTNGGCAAVVQAGVDPDGNCWRLVSCMPAQFRRPEPDECPGVLESCD